MDKELGKQLIKSAAAVLCVASICITATSSVGKISEAVKETASAGAADVSGSAENNDTETGGFEANSPEADADGTAEAGEEAQTPDDTASSPEQTQVTPSAADKDKTNKPQAGSSVPSSKAEIINYCNTALNKVKSSKPGYDKKYTMNIQGKATGAIDKIKGLVTKDEQETVAKGSNLNDSFPAAGYAWSSKLREQDVKDAQIKTNGQYYEITLKLGNETNPAKGEASSYGRVMSVIDANDAKGMLPGIKSITMNYHNGYVYAKIDSKTGNVVKAEFSAAADIKATIAIFGNIEVNDIVSTETFTNFKW